MKRILSIVVILFILFVIIYVTLHGSNDKPLTTSAKRDHVESDVVYIDDEAIALAGSPSADIEMRTLAVAAYEETNTYRESQGVAPLVWSERLAMDAIVRAQEIEDKFSHTRPNGTDWWTVDSEHMYGENLAQGYSTSDAVVNAWINSQSHRENLENDEYVTCGISAWRGEDGVIYISQEFGY